MIDNIFLCLILLGAMLLLVTSEVIGLGGQCWVAKLLAWLRDSPTHAFDWVATTPAVLAEILGDDGAKLSDIAYYRSRGAKGGHIQHEWYERFVMQGGFGFVAQQFMQKRLPAMFQHNTEGGKSALSATLQRRLKLMCTRLDGPQWKVLLYGFAIPWSVYKELPDLSCDRIFDSELAVLFEKLKQKGVDNFALVAFIVVDGVPAREKFPERRRVLSPRCTSHYQVVIRYMISFRSKRVGAHFEGMTANQEMYELCKKVTAVREQFGWREVPVDGVGGRVYFHNPELSMSVWSRRDLHGQVSIRVGMLVETNAEIKCTLALHGYGGVVKARTWIVILYVGQNGDDAGYIYGQVFESEICLWLSFTSIRELGCQVPLVLGDVAGAAGGVDGVFVRGASSAGLLDSSHTSNSSRLNSRPSITFESLAFSLPTEHRLALIFSDSTLLPPDENSVCVFDRHLRPLGDIIGRSGGCFTGGTFNGLSRTVIATVCENFSQFPSGRGGFRVGYVPAGNCHPVHDFHSHHLAQSRIFGETDWIAAPALNDLREQCFKGTGVALFRSRGVHCTDRGRLWLQKFLFFWAHSNGVSLLFCVGWNSDSPDNEYRLQRALGTSLQNSLS